LRLLLRKSCPRRNPCPRLLNLHDNMIVALFLERHNHYIITYAHIFPSIDEFVAILPEMDTTQAQVLIDWLRSAVTAKFVR